MTNIKNIAITFLIFLISNYSCANESIDVFFINGILNTEEMAVESKKKLRSILDESRNHVNKKKFNVTEIYNPDGFHIKDKYLKSSFQDFLTQFNIPKRAAEFVAGKEEDLNELFISKYLEEYYHSVYDQIKANNSAENYPILDRFSAEIMFDMLQYEVSTFSSPINTAIFQNFRELPSNKTIIVSHSQGNLFANYIWAYLVKEYGDLAYKKVRIINVANTSLFAPNGLNLTHSNDAQLFQRTGQLCNAISLEAYPQFNVFNLSRATPLCSKFGNGEVEDWCPFSLSEPTYYINEIPIIDRIFDCMHSFSEVYTSSIDVFQTFSEDSSFIDTELFGTQFRDRLENLIYAAVDSLDKANEVSVPSINAHLTQSVPVNTAPVIGGVITSKHRISNIQVDFSPPPIDSIFDGLTHTIFSCTVESTDTDCTEFDKQNTGEVDLSFIQLPSSKFPDVGNYEITVTARNSAGQQGSAVFSITALPKINQLSIPDSPVQTGVTFTLNVSGLKLNSSVKAYVSGGSDCHQISIQENAAEFSCVAHESGTLKYVIYYNDKTTELSSGTLNVTDATLCDPNSTESQACTIVNGIGAQIRTCSAEGEWGAYEACMVQSCNDGYQVVGNSCQPNPPPQVCTPNTSESQACSIANGTGLQTRTCSNDGLSWGEYGSCLVQSCDTGYRTEGNICVENIIMPIPQNVQATSDDSEVFLKWESISEADKYTVYWDTQPGVSTTSNTGKLTATQNQTLVTNLLNDQKYYFAVTASDANGNESSPSVEVEVTPAKLVASTKRISLSSTGEETPGVSTEQHMSRDGRYIVFQSTDGNLVDNDTNERVDVFFRDLETGTTECISRCSVGDGPLRGHSKTPSISDAGRYITFQSSKSFGLDGESPFPGFGEHWYGEDIFVYDRLSETYELINHSLDEEGANQRSEDPSISADGRYVVFESWASNLVDNDTNDAADIFMYDRQMKTLKRISISSQGNEGNGHSKNPVISANGQFIAFTSEANNLVSENTNSSASKPDIFVYDVVKQAIELITLPLITAVESEGAAPSISSDGRYVSFASSANLLEVDSNTHHDVYVRDRLLGQTQLVSINSNGEAGNAESGVSSISSDGRFIAFRSKASNLVTGDDNTIRDIFRHDLLTHKTEKISVSSTRIGGNANSGDVVISADGKRITFFSDANNLVDLDNNQTGDIFLWSLEKPAIEK